MLLVAACSGGSGAESASRPSGDGTEPSGGTQPATTDDATSTTGSGSSRSEEILAELTVEEKIGQLLMPVMAGSDASQVSEAEAAANQEVFGYSTPAEVVAAYKLGGVIYLSNNIVAADQVGILSAGLQAAAEADTGIGLLIAVDQEGGRVSRITDGVTVFPPAALLSGDTDAVREAGYLTGRQVSVQGINVVLAPVADVTPAAVEGAISNRSYGDDPQVVADMVVAAIDGLQGSGVAAAVKHWPGHGATQVDSHQTLPVLDISRSDWEARDQLPFRAAIDEQVDIVLVGHLAMPGIDPEAGPATTSTVLIQDILRGELGFDGVVMTDALNMGAVSQFDAGEIVVDAVVAGADILLVPPDLPTAHGALMTAAADGTLTAERLDEAVLRVLILKERLGLLPDD
jgi:beta-N-acetylhexosaminidase